MTPGVLMAISGILFGVFLIVLFVNFFMLMGRSERSFEMPRINFILHGVLGMLTGISFLGLVGGFVWFLVDKYAS